MTDTPIIGHWYSGPVNRPNPRKVIAVEPFSRDSFHVTYETTTGKQRTCWCSTWLDWATTDLGPDWSKA